MIATKTAKKGGIILKKRKKDVSSMLGVVCVCVCVCVYVGGCGCGCARAHTLDFFEKVISAVEI